MSKLGDFIAQCGRVLRVTKKPTKEEFKSIALVSAIGLLVIGFIGFALHIVTELSSISITVVLSIVLILGLMFIKKK